MSRLWDTPEYWARREADEALREMPEVSPGALADSLERKLAGHDEQPDMAAMIVVDLRRREAAGVRFRQEPQPIDTATVAMPSSSNIDIGDLIDDEIPW